MLYKNETSNGSVNEHVSEQVSIPILYCEIFTYIISRSHYLIITLYYMLYFH